MSDELERVPLTALEKQADELRKAERMMNKNDQLIHLEVQGVLKEQALQMEILARIRNVVKRMDDRLIDIELDRDGLKMEVDHLRAECEQMHVRQNATDARLDVLKSIFDAGLIEIREANKTVSHLLESVAGVTEE